MKIKRFVGRDIHKYLNFNIKFNDDVNFLTGINGSGKTSVIRSISALITPSISQLLMMDYSQIEILIEHEKKEIKIETSKTKTNFKISVSPIKESLEIPLLVRENYEIGFDIEREKEFYKELEKQHQTNPIVSYILQLPTPMILGLERRGADRETSLEQLRYLRHNFQRRYKNVFANTLFASLSEAASIAEHSYRTLQANIHEKMEELRKEILLIAFKYEEGIRESDSFSAPKIKLADIKNSKRIIRSTFGELGVSVEEVEQQLDKYFSKLSNISKILPKEVSISATLDGNDERKKEAIIEWIINKPQLDRFTRILERIEQYVKDSSKIDEPIKNYLSVINNFLNDSHKNLEFNEIGNLVVKVKEEQTNPITALSSGESQIVVLITHLAFNPAAKVANIFIVDEPELSLHLRWQELFVDSIRKINPGLQLILSTHAPAIILDRVKQCIDLKQ